MWTQSTSVTDGRTDGRTDRITITDTVQTASHGKNCFRMTSVFERGYEIQCRSTAINQCVYELFQHPNATNPTRRRRPDDALVDAN